MSINEDELDELDEEPEPKLATLPRADLRRLEKNSKAKEAAEARAEAAERRLALRDAGIPTNPLGKLFEKAYDGPYDDVEAIKAAAMEYGVIQQEETSASAEEQAAHRGIAQASVGAGVTAVDDYAARIAEAKSPEDVMALARANGTPISLDRQ